MAGDILRIPHFLRAKSPEGLFRAMLINNLKDGLEYSYSDFEFDGKQWITWFLKKLDRMDLMDQGLSSVPLLNQEQAKKESK